MGRLKDRLRGIQPEYYESYTEPEPDVEPVYDQPVQPQPQIQPQPEQEEEEPNLYDNPLAILDEIKKQPSPRGTLPTIIGGRPVDLHTLENYVIKISPYQLRTVLRYHNARTIEEIRNYSQRFGTTKIKGSTILVILLAIGMAVMGLFAMMYLPQIIRMFVGG